MKYYRFMSKLEYTKLLNGSILTNDNPHDKSRTSSHGFCFLREDSSLFSDSLEKSFNAIRDFDEPWDSASEFLSGIVTSDYFVEFETTEDDYFSEGYGIYADPYDWAWDARCCVREYSLIEYDASWLRPVRAWQWNAEDFNFVPVHPTCATSDSYWEKYEYLYDYLR